MQFTKKTLIICMLLCAFTSNNAQQLYVGSNYHPHDDKDIDKIKKDIALMKEAGFNVVRMGHLAWDSYEPSDSIFDFEWFDRVMDEMQKAGIKVILDIAIRPAPIWLHSKYPSINIVNPSGNMLYANHRYMEDVGDSMYKKYALRFTDVISKRYAKHPALLAFGIDNESGDGPISFSESVRKRFINWLEAKYGNIDNLNSCWATHRWSRRINQFEEVGLPAEGSKNGSPEKILDFRQFISDEEVSLLNAVLHKVNQNAPNALTNTNAWYYSPMKYFDYAQIAYSGKMTREGCGFYPGNSLTTNWGLMNAAFGISRIQFESKNPFWCSEFTTMTAVPNSIRKSAYATLFYGNQMVCGWTWQSMWAGEEQYLQGMLNWDGTPNRKYLEYKKIASEFKLIEKYLPYKPQPEIGLAFSFQSQIASQSFPVQHENQLQTCWNIFFRKNMDVNVVDISKSALQYKVLLIPGVTVINPTTADKIKTFVRNGGTVIMTSNSALVNETGQVFKSALPGYLSDLFGIKIDGYEETEIMNEISPTKTSGKQLSIDFNKKNLTVSSERFDIIQPIDCEVLGNISSLHQNYPLITSHQYGKGKAIYIGICANEPIIEVIINQMIKEKSLKSEPNVPEGVLARQIDKNHYLYLNISTEAKLIPMDFQSVSLLTGKNYSGDFSIPPFEPEFIEIK